MNLLTTERINNAAGALQNLLNTPFPDTPSEPNDDCSWEPWQVFLSNGPGRLIEVISLDYHDCVSDEEDEDEIPCDDLFYDHDKNYRAIYRQCVTLASEAMGAGTVLTRDDIKAYCYRDTSVSHIFKPSGPTVFDSTPLHLFNTELVLYTEWKMELTYWIKGDRIAFVHYAGDKGDDDFQFAVSVGVLPLHIDPEP